MGSLGRPNFKSNSLASHSQLSLHVLQINNSLHIFIVIEMCLKHIFRKKTLFNIYFCDFDKIMSVNLYFLRLFPSSFKNEKA